MQLIDSTPLSKLLQEHGTFTPHETARVGAEVGAALAAAHRRKIVHRDVKPGNILVREDGSAMISDFGIAQALGDTTITATGLVHGTPAYLAPEVARGDPSSFASDVFSLGSTLFAMLEGAPPFGTDRNAIALLHRVAQGDVAVPGSAGPLAPLLVEMLSPDPKARPDMADVARRLTELAEQSSTADAAGPSDDADTGPATIPVAGAAGAAGAAGGAAAAAAAEHQPPTVPATTRAVGDTAETESLAEPEAEPAAEPVGDAAETESLAGADEAEPAPHRENAAGPLFPWMAETQADTQQPTRPAAPQHPSPQPPEQDGTRRRKRRAALVAGALVALGLLVLGGILLVNGLQQDGGTAAGPDPRETATSEPAESEAPPADSSPSEEPSEEPAPPPEEPAEQAPEQRVAAMLTDYYSLVPGDLDSAWSLMTEDYQVNHVGGRDAYEAFWAEISDAEISDVNPTAPDRAEATLTYTFDDGRVVREVTAYRLVDEGGVLKIAESAVLSSTEL
jgi:hypothetical protein